MSFSWKGLLGVNNQNTPASSLASPSTSVTAIGSAASSANTANHATPNSFAGNATATSSSAGASAMSTSASRTALNANPYSATQNPTPPVPLFGAMIPGSTSYHSTSFIPSSASTTQSSIISRKPSEIPVNSVEGGGYLLGMENFGNTCYVNSIIQSLYFCRPFRDSLLSYKSAGRERSESDAGSQHGIHTIGDIASRTLPDPTPEAIDGVPPSDTMFAALSDLFDVFQQSGQQKALSSPTRSTAPGSLPLSSPISPFPPASTPADSPAVTRKTSILGRPSTAGTTSGRGGAGGHAVSAATVNASATAAQAIPITPNSVAGSGPPNLSISTSTIGTVASGFPSVDSNAVKAFLSTLKRENVLFDSTMHQDAHEMLNFVLNKVGEDLIDADKATKNRVKMQSRNPYLNARTESDKTVDAQRKRSVMEVGPNGKTCVHRLFEGVLTNETRCLTCETVTSRDECFLDLSIDIEKNSSVTSCLRQFSASEMLRSRNKFFCDSCSGLQEAEKRMKIKKLPNVLALHLKRFKYEETVQRYVKLAYRVVFPQELRLFNTSDDAEDPDRLYELCAIVVHIGAGPHHGHYIAVVKVGDRWVQFDDDVVTYIDEAEITKYYGDRPGLGSAYVLFYQAVDLDFEGLGLEDPALQAMVQQRIAAAADADGRGRAGLKVPDLADPRSNISPDRSGAVPATANRSRLGSVTEGSAMSPTGAASSDAGQGSNGWFGSFRNREKRAGSQSRRRPKTGSSAEPAAPGLPELPASTTVGDLAKVGAADVGGTPPDDASVSTHSTAANDATSRGASGLTSTSATPATEHTASRGLPSGSLASGEAGVSPVRTGFSTMDTMPGSTTDTDASRATTESPSESKYGRMLSNQGTAAANREAREQNLMRGVMNRRARAASEGFPSSGMTAEAPLDTNGRSAVFGGNFVAEPEARHHAVVTPSILEPNGAPAAAVPIPSQREASTSSGFAPLERLLSSKNQKSQAKTARRASSSYTPLSPTAEKGEKKEGMLSNLFSSSSSASSSAAQSKRSSMQLLSNGTNANSAAAGAVEEGNQPTRKPSLSTRTLSKTFGFGRNKQG